MNGTRHIKLFTASQAPSQGSEPRKQIASRVDNAREKRMAEGAALLAKTMKEIKR